MNEMAIFRQLPKGKEKLLMRVAFWATGPLVTSLLGEYMERSCYKLGSESPQRSVTRIWKVKHLLTWCSGRDYLVKSSLRARPSDRAPKLLA